MRNVLEWLEASAERVPDKVAVADENAQLTFAELLDRAQKAGSYVARRSAPCTPVALLARKSVSLLAAMMGVVYARGCYCVLDERQPEARLQSIVDTLGPTIVLADAEHRDQALAAFAGKPVSVESLEDALASDVDSKLLAELREDALDVDPLYINFTSGSTGTPKGVAVGHRSVIDFIGQFTSIFDICEDDRIGNQAPFDFDVSVKDIYSTLATGATMHLIPREYFSVPVQLMDFLCDRQITVCTWAVSALCFVSIMGGLDYRLPESIRQVIFSGEIMPVKQLNVWKAHLPNARYVNVYGPTEITCNCTYYIIDREFERGDTIPMGRSFPNEKVFLVSEDGALVTEDEPGEPGEIYVGGTALALGYWNMPERTAEAFVQNPLNTTYNEIVYKTGDLARYDEDGNLVYIGRADHQIKHMGQRIELGEIETAAQSISQVERACCVYNAKKKRIVMFYSGAAGKDELVDQLREKLPSFMVPNKTVQLDVMPLTKNGKIDRTELAKLA